MQKLLIIIFIFIYIGANAQMDSSTKASPTLPPTNAKHKSPATATWLSLALPGAGHVYNGKSWWWKVPIIYGAGAGLLYGVSFYNKNYLAFKDAYSYRIETGSDVNNDPRFDRFQTTTLLSLRDAYKSDRDLCIIGLVVLYSLQAVDACVEAHFLDFNITDDLSLNIQPYYIPAGPAISTGVQFTLNIK
jgi:hypothetical protein